MDIDGTGVAVVFVAPDFVEQLVAGERAALVGDEKLQQLIFLRV